jgi:DegV family protein with EDD domain
MVSVAVIADSTASLPLALCLRHHIAVVPYYLHLEGQSWRDGVDVTPEQLNAYLRALPDGAELPRTANPGPGDYCAAFVRAAERAREIVSFHMTSLGSGAYQAALIGRGMALERLNGVRIEVVDTLNVAMAHGWPALQAARAAELGASLDDILARVRRMLPRARLLQTADTLRYLYMGGRIGRAGHLIGSLLQIKPIVSMEEGVIMTVGVARSRAAAQRRMAELVARALHPGERIRLALTHAGAAAEAAELGAALRAVCEPLELLTCELSPALAVHSGPGTVGVCYLREDAD